MPTPATATVSLPILLLCPNADQLANTLHICKVRACMAVNVPANTLL